MTDPRPKIAELLKASDPLSDANCTALLNYREEDQLIDFKESFDPTSDKSWIDLAIDCVAFANTYGGYIVFGVVNGTWKEVGVGPEEVAVLTDTKRVLDQVNKCLAPPIVHMRTRSFASAAGDMAFVVAFIPPTLNATHIYESNRDIPLPGGRSQPRIQKGAIFVRRVASNQILVSADFENLVNRRIDRFRDRILEGLTKVVRAEADEEIVTVRVAPTKGGARNVTIVSAAESLAISGKTVSIALNGIADRVSAYMALSSSGGGAVVPEAFLYEAYALRAELQDADQYKWLALESLVVGVPAFYWLSHLDKAIARSIIDAASKRARWCREQVRDVAGFYGETLYKKLNDRLEDHGLKKAFRPKAQLFGTSKSKVPIADSARATDQAKALAERSDASLRWQLVKLDCALYAPF